MIVLAYNGYPTPKDANVYLGHFTNQYWSRTEYVRWYSSDGSEEDRKAYEAEKTRRSSLPKVKDNYPIWM